MPNRPGDAGLEGKGAASGKPCSVESGVRGHLAVQSQCGQYRAWKALQVSPEQAGGVNSEQRQEWYCQHTKSSFHKGITIYSRAKCE